MHIDDVSLEIAQAVAEKYSVREGTARRRVLAVADLLGLQIPDAADFLLEALPGSGVQVAGRILLLARAANVSPKAILEKDDGGSCRTSDSTLAEELNRLLGELPAEGRQEVLEEVEGRYQETFLASK